MKIATYNVNSINARLPVLLHWLASSKPDVACLQELKTVVLLSRGVELTQPFLHH